jgi:RNA polymerase sigma factor (sigma-70 family)
MKIDNDSSETELWLAFRDADRVAFTRLYQLHAKTVTKYAWAILRSGSAAEEALQETFLVAWERRRASRLTDESLLPWLLVVCRNVSRNQMRKNRVLRAAVSLNETSAGRELTGSPSQSLDWIADELSDLSDIDAHICRLCLVDGYSYSEAARILDTTEVAVGKRLQRARAKLRASISTNDF